MREEQLRELAELSDEVDAALCCFVSYLSIYDSELNPFIAYSTHPRAQRFNLVDGGRENVRRR